MGADEGGASRHASGMVRSWGAPSLFAALRCHGSGVAATEREEAAAILAPYPAGSEDRAAVAGTVASRGPREESTFDGLRRMRGRTTLPTDQQALKGRSRLGVVVLYRDSRRPDGRMPRLRRRATETRMPSRRNREVAAAMVTKHGDLAYPPFDVQPEAFGILAKSPAIRGDRLVSVEWD